MEYSFTEHGRDLIQFLREELSFGQAKVRYFDIANKAAADRCSVGGRLHALYSKIERCRFNANWHLPICVAQV